MTDRLQQLLDGNPAFAALRQEHTRDWARILDAYGEKTARGAKELDWQAVPDLDKEPYFERMARLESFPEHFQYMRLASRPAGQNQPTAADEKEAFGLWFGRSKVVDADGNPLLLYHGTDASISTFRPSERGLFGQGIYLTTDVFDAEQYGQALHLHAKLERPYYAKADYSDGEEIDFDSPAVQFIRDLFGDQADEVLQQSIDGDGAFGREIREKLESVGHDGIIATWPDGLQHVIAFHPEQIKSATDNEGLFDPSSPDIRRSFAGSNASGAPGRHASLATAAEIRTAITKAYGGLLAQLEGKGLATITQTQDQAIAAAAQARAAKTGGDAEQIKRALMASVYKSIRAWHGSPHQFDRFSLDKIGAGEGVQAYGWGLYFASNEVVARKYRRAGETAAPIQYLGEGVMNWALGNREAANSLPKLTQRTLAWVRDFDSVEQSSEMALLDGRPDVAEEIERLAAHGLLQNTPIGPLYDVNILPQDEEFLLWDRPLSEQPKKVQAAIERLQMDAGLVTAQDALGEDLYRALTDIFAKEGRERVRSGEFIADTHVFGQRLASESLAELGVKGIKYLDGNSRNARHGTFNYVLFDDDDVEIVDVKFSANGSVQGFFDPQTGQSFMVADNLSTQTAPGVLMHEVGVHIAASGDLQPVFDRARQLLEQERGDPFMQRVQARMDAADESSAEEAAAYIVEEYEIDRIQAPTSVAQWSKDLIAGVRAWLYKRGLIESAASLTVADIAAIARANAAHAAASQSDGDVRFSRAGSQPASTFYSQLRRVFESLPDRLKTMTAHGWGQWLNANAAKLGVKSEELEWSGIKDYLSTQGDNKLTRDDLAQYMQEHGVKIKEVVHKGVGQNGSDEWFAERNGPENYDVMDGAGKVIESGFLARQTAQSFIDAERNIASTKYQDYALPGGKNYREILLTLPEKTSATPERAAYERWTRANGFGAHPNATAAENQYLRDTGLTAPAPRTMSDMNRDRGRNYKSGHWDQLNVLAHLRVSDHADANDRKVLFVEELQSDWSKEARTKGIRQEFADPSAVAITAKTMTGREFVAERSMPAGAAQLWLDGRNDIRRDLGKEPMTLDDAVTVIYEGDTPKVVKDGSVQAEQAKIQYERSLQRIAQEQKLLHEKNQTGKVPPAPFIAKTESWLNLALKRVIMMAVDEGYDKVAFVTGEQSADRYDLSKQVDMVWISRTERSGTWEVSAYKQGSSEPDISKQVSTIEDVAAIVGKEAAQKVKDLKPGEDRKLQGIDLKVGGEGMAVFYDQIVPQHLNKLLPKLGGEKIEQVIIEMPKGTTLEQAGFTITEKMRQTVGAGVPLFSRKDQTQTPQFRHWFGDSKVVDDDGRPRVVYHGTAAQFDEFSRSKAQDKHGRKLGLGWGKGKFYFAKTGEAASSAALFAAATGRGETPNVIPVYLSLRNPISAANYLSLVAQQQSRGKSRDQAIAAVDKSIVAAGHDGILDRESGGIAVFRPEQIKSAIGNNGGFDPASTDIRFSRKKKAENSAARPEDLHAAEVSAWQHFKPKALAQGIQSIKSADRLSSASVIALVQEGLLAPGHPQFPRDAVDANDGEEAQSEVHPRQNPPGF